MTRAIVPILLSLFLVSCAAKLHYAADYPLTGEIFQSRDGLLKGKVPLGWFISADDTLAPSLSVWLLREDINATMIVRELIVDSLTAARIKSDGLELLAVLSAGYQGLKIGSDIINLEEYSLAGEKYCSYEAGAENDRRRVVVFKARGRYYECEARILNGDRGTNRLRELFSVQQSVLASLIY